MVESAGADAIGLVFYEPSPRAVSIAIAKQIREAISPMVTLVALVVDAADSFVQQIIREVQPDIVQYHGSETAYFCDAIGHPYWKAVRVRNAQDVIRASLEFKTSRSLLLDAWVDGIPGGTGHEIDRSAMPESFDRPWILAGGLKPDNVSKALSHYRPSAVDVSSGVESSPGVKDPLKVRAFINAVVSFDKVKPHE
jgi:phosphoribosylanthranilate isomerase